jgi:hypothetical protein
MSVARIVCAGLWFSLSACGGPRLVTVPTGPQPASAPRVKVDYPPPPAKIEEIRIAHGSAGGCVWRDGYWDWTGGRWEWQEGRPVLPVKGCLYADAKLAWSADSLSFYRPAWYPDPASKEAPKTCTEIACVPLSGEGTSNPEAPAP